MKEQNENINVSIAGSDVVDVLELADIVGGDELFGSVGDFLSGAVGGILDGISIDF